MSVVATKLFDAQYAPNSDTLVYTASGRTIIDKFSATNTDGSARTISVYIVPSGDAVDPEFLITSAYSLNSGVSADLPELKNHILGPGDTIYVKASVSAKVVVRASGREIS